MALLNVPRVPRWARAATGVLLAGFLATRLRMLTGLPYFLDEGIYADFSYRGARSTSQLFVALSIGKQPLQAWLGIPWQWLGANPLVAMRLVSASAGLLTLVPLYALGRRAAGRLAGLLTAALAVGIPFLLVNDAVGIEEPLVALVMASALALQLRLAERPSLRRGAALAVVLAAGILTKQSCEAAVALLPVGLVGLDWRPRGRRARLVRWTAGAGLALAGALVAGVALRASHYWATGRAFDRLAPLVRPFGSVLRHPFATAPHAWRVFEPALTGYVTLPLLALAGTGALVLWRSQPRLVAVLVAWVLVPAAAALLFTLVPYPRHLIYALPPALVLMAVALMRGWAALRGRLGPRRAAMLAAAAGLLGVPALLLDARVLAHPVTARYPGLDDLQYVTGIPAGGAWPHLVAAIRRRAQGRRVVVFVAQADPNIVRFLLSADPAAPGGRYYVVLPGQPAAARAQFAIVDQLPFGNPRALALIARQGLVPVGRFSRPRGGPAIILYGRPRA